MANQLLDDEVRKIQCYCRQYFSFEIDFFRVGILVFLLLSGIYIAEEHKRCQNLLKINESRQVWTSKASMERLHERELDLIEAMKSYVECLQNKIDILRSGLSQMDVNESRKSLTSPIFQFAMLRRLRIEWESWLQYISQNDGKGHVNHLRYLLEQIPDFNFKQASVGLAMVQDANKLKSMRNDTTEDDYQLNSWDCFAVAFILHNAFEFRQAESWLEAAMFLFDKNKRIYNSLNFKYSSIENLYIANLLKQNKVAEAMAFISRAMDQNLKNTKLKELKTFMRSQFDLIT